MFAVQAHFNGPSMASSGHRDGVMGALPLLDENFGWKRTAILTLRSELWKKKSVNGPARWGPASSSAAGSSTSATQVHIITKIKHRPRHRKPPKRFHPDSNPQNKPISTMDPYSAEGELINIHNHFHQGQYQEVVDFDVSALSPENALPARVLQLRARVALGQAEDVLADVQGAPEPELQAVGALAEQALGNAEKAVETVETLAQGSAADNATVQIVGGTVLQAAGKSEEALALLGRHQGNLDAVALIVQIHLQQNRNDLALKEVAAARRWAQDSLLVNFAESWVGLRLGGEKYQQAFYVFEELAQAPATSSVRTLVAQAVAELHLGRTEEAQAALNQAMKKEPEYAEAIANLLVLNVIIGKSPEELTSALQKANPEHPFLTDLAEKSDLFDRAATKYKARVAA
ncbi:hypothetical protein N657DRAFT_501813 [Parathielavia appendiculata]|uniref:Coatomer subunit epsilon n=1 Tax=Parathielavia appendiculata TaxID=2587402 RepID=A0AAN6TXJ2_9PEZI|nr:hypothetical protein N657DRAFT_501813 [Parathielavia appendiculata]